MTHPSKLGSCILAGLDPDYPGNKVSGKKNGPSLQLLLFFLERTHFCVKVGGGSLGRALE
jgi:hypothetical protein